MTDVTTSSPGYGLALVAEGTVGSTGEDDTQVGGVVLGAECVAEGGTLPEDLGRKAAYTLLSEVANVKSRDVSSLTLDREGVWILRINLRCCC